MGGSVCANAVDKINKESNCTVVGLCVLDAVEGTALEALPWMVGIVNNQPKKFDTLNSAIAWQLVSYFFIYRDHINEHII